MDIRNEKDLQESLKILEIKKNELLKSINDLSNLYSSIKKFFNYNKDKDGNYTLICTKCLRDTGKLVQVVKRLSPIKYEEKISKQQKRIEEDNNETKNVSSLLSDLSNLDLLE